MFRLITAELLTHESALKEDFCPAQQSLETTEPIVSLRPDYFLYPILAGGPLRQMRGLRESVLLAVKLNRTLILERDFQGL